MAASGEARRINGEMAWQRAETTYHGKQHGGKSNGGGISMAAARIISEKWQQHGMAAAAA